ncbi:MAG: V-type ATPase subunit, partial [Oscillospiraceae bacterium]
MSFSSNSIITKARAIYGAALSADDYSQMCAKTTVAEVAAFLKQTDRYRSVLSGINPQTVHRGQLETLISKNILDVFERFHKFDFSDSRAFFRYIIMELEAEQILTAIEGVAAG